MRLIKPITLFILLIGVLVLCSCGGGSALVDTPENNTGSTSPTADTGTGGWDSLPSIPLDEGEAPHAASDVPEGIAWTTVAGTDYLQMGNAYVDGTSLVISTDAQEDESVMPPLGYGLYKVSGLSGKRPLAMNIECIPGGLGEGYFVGVADYTRNAWHWFGPITLPEFELDLYEVDHQLVTHLGNMYFLVVAPPGNSATHVQTTVIYGDPGSNVQPGFPHHLVASDG